MMYIDQFVGEGKYINDNDTTDVPFLPPIPIYGDPFGPHS
jgi:hypothetical protein